MIDQLTVALKATVVKWLGAHYATGTDLNASTPIYKDEGFDPGDSETYSHLNSAPEYSIVLHNVRFNNLGEHPHSALKIEYLADITLVRKSANQWSVSDRHNRIMMGSESAPLGNALLEAAGMLAIYLRQVALDTGSGSYISYWQDITGQSGLRSIGDWASITVSIRALFMVDRTTLPTPQ